MKNHHQHPHRLHPHHLPPHWRGRRRLFFPFVFFFGGITFLFLFALAVISYFGFTDAPTYFHGRMLILLCAVPILFIFISMVIGALTFRRFGKPMTEIFSAIDSVAEGDLSVRVPEEYPRQFGSLMKRFNYMVSELERADQQRRNLTADIAHELRTPLHIIQGNLEGMMDGVYEPTSEHINNTLDETKLLARLVDDLQTLSLAEARQLPLHPTRFLLADLLHDLTSSFSTQASSLGIDFKTNINDSTLELNADYDRLNQVLSNLISNAFRHTPEGGTISINIESQIIQSRSEAKWTNHDLRITVHDTGLGIPAQDLPFIFDRFWRGDKSRTGRVNSGLGLAIA